MYGTAVQRLDIKQAGPCQAPFGDSGVEAQQFLETVGMWQHRAFEEQVEKLALGDIARQIDMLAEQRRARGIVVPLKLETRIDQIRRPLNAIERQLQRSTQSRRRHASR